MKSPYLLALFVLIALAFACARDRKNGPEATKIAEKNQLLFKIDSLEKAMKSLPPNAPEDAIITVGMEMGDAYQRYAVKYSEDSLAPFCTMKLGQVYEHILKDPQMAGEYYQQTILKYPKYAQRDEALFHLGNLYLDHDRAAAKNCFSHLLKDYPDSKYKSEAIAMIKIADDSSLNATIHRFQKEQNTAKTPTP